MSITIKKNNISFRKEDGTFHTTNVLAEQSTAQLIREIEIKGEDTLNTIPDDYLTLYNTVNSYQEKPTSDVFYAKGYDYGEVGIWNDGNPNEENRLYRFVTLVNSGNMIKIAEATDQIVGVTTDTTGFVGNAQNYDKSDKTKDIVGVLGIVPVKTNDNTIIAGDRVMSDNNGYAIKSTNNCGYRVLRVVETGLLEIVVSPNTDMTQRIKTDVSGILTTISTMSTKLDGIAEGANNYSHPTYTSKTSGLYKITVDSTGHVSAATAVAKSDITGLGIPAQDTTYSVATQSANGLMSSTDKTKLDGIADGANNYSHPSYTSKTSGLYKITVDGTGHVSAATAVAKADITGLGIPAQDTTYNAATTSTAGLMSAADKTKLESIAEGANNYTYTLPTAGTNSLGGVKTTSDTTSSTGYIASPIIDGIVYYKDTNTTYNDATTTTHGLMSTDDKTKLDGVATGANNYSHPTYTSKTSGLYKITVDGTGHVSAATAVAKADITGLGIPAQDTTYSDATQTAHGLLSTTDKTKLDGIAEGANNYSLPTAGTNTLGGVKTTSTVTSTSGLTASPIINGNVYYKDTNTTYSAATTSAAGLMSTSDKTKLDGIATGANNYSHPTSHAATMITEDTTHRFITDTERTAWNAKVGLDENGLIPSSVLPSFVDDVIEGYLSSSKFYKTRSGASGSYTYSSEITGESGKIYVDLESNKTYRYSGSAFVVISETLALGETSSTAYAGNKGKANADAIAAITNGTTTVPSASNAATVNNLTVLTAVPANAKFTDTTYSTVTQSANGLMSSTDKTKLDGIATGANNYSHPTYTSKTSGLYKITVDGTGHVSAATAVAKSDITGLGIPAQDTTYSAATTSTAGLMSTDDKTKLDGIATGANNYSHPTYTSKTSGLYKITVDGTGHISAATAVAKSDITGLGIPGQDTTYSAATTSTAGLMSASDKTKLDGIATGANNYTYTLPTAGTNTLGGVKTTSTVTSTSGLTASPIIDGNVYYKDTNTTYSIATQSANGLMSSTDKTKLDGIATGANNYSHPTYTSKTSGLYKITVDGTGHVSAATAVAKSDITGLGIPAQDTTYSAATTSTTGLMSAADKTKLESIAEGANNYSHPTTSGNKHIPSGGSSGQILKWSADGTAAWDTVVTSHIATLSNGTTTTTTKGYTYGTAAVTSSPYTAAKWYANLNTGVTSLTDGMMIAIKVPVSGNGTYGTLLTIDGTNFHPVVTGINSLVGTRYGINSIIVLVYNSIQSANVYQNSTSAAGVTGVWVIVNDYDSGNTNTIPASYCITAAGTSAKTASHDYYALLANSYTLVTMRYANSYNGKITLNINSKGAKDIYINGTISSSTNKTLPAGTYLVYYDGTGYHFRTDGRIHGVTASTSADGLMSATDKAKLDNVCNVYTGTSQPSDSLGENGDFYFMIID